MQSWAEIMGEPPPEHEAGARIPPPRCDVCGRFARVKDLQLLWSGGPEPEPIEVACSSCRKKRAPGVAL